MFPQKNLARKGLKEKRICVHAWRTHIRMQWTYDSMMTSIIMLKRRRVSAGSVTGIMGTIMKFSRLI